jgi:hypothetical protein
MYTHTHTRLRPQTYDNNLCASSTFWYFKIYIFVTTDGPIMTVLLEKDSHSECDNIFSQTLISGADGTVTTISLATQMGVHRGQLVASDITAHILMMLKWPLAKLDNLLVRIMHSCACY